MGHELKIWPQYFDIEEVSGRKVLASNQYGMLFLLNETGGIILNVTRLLDSPEEKRNAGDAS